MTEENSFISVKCGPEVTAALCARFFFFLLLLRSVSGSLRLRWLNSVELAAPLR